MQEADSQVRRNLQLAERLGADVTVLTGESVVDEILNFAINRNVNKIVIGKPSLTRWRERLRGSIVDDLIRRSGEIDVHVVKVNVMNMPGKLRRVGRSMGMTSEWKKAIVTLDKEHRIELF